MSLPALLAGGRLVQAPGVFDGLSAMLVQQSPAPAAYLSGYAVAASRAGLPDAGLTGLRELLDTVAVVRGRCDKPLIVDADTGYGGLLNVQHTVRELEQLGIAAVQLEDQEMPKRCGHTRGKHLVECSEMQAKIAVAAETRADAGLLIVARTDARAVEGLDAALARARAYREAGADVLFVEAPESREELRRIAGELDGPLLVNVVPAGMRTPPLPAEELRALGFAIAIYPGALALAAVGAMDGALRRLLMDGTQAAPTVDVHALVGFGAVWADEERWQERFAGTAAA